MKNKKAIRILESIDYYLKTHTNESCEEEHTALNHAIKALRIVEVIEDSFKHSSNLMIDSDDWEDIKKFVEKEAENEAN